MPISYDSVFVVSAVDFFGCLKGASRKDPAWLWMGWGPLCNLVNAGALRVGNVSEPCAGLPLAGRADSPSPSRRLKKPEFSDARVRSP